jgi:predicted RNA-binding protein with PUA-like domain
MVDLKLVRIFATPLSLESLRPLKALKEMELLRKGSRLSVQPVRKTEFDAIVKLEEAAAADKGEEQKVAVKKKR